MPQCKKFFVKTFLSTKSCFESLISLHCKTIYNLKSKMFFTDSNPQGSDWSGNIMIAFCFQSSTHRDSTTSYGDHRQQWVKAHLYKTQLIVSWRFSLSSFLTEPVAAYPWGAFHARLVRFTATRWCAILAGCSDLCSETRAELLWLHSSTSASLLSFISVARDCTGSNMFSTAFFALAVCIGRLFCNDC